MAELRGKYNGRIYRIKDTLGSGGEGTVYSIVGDTTRVMKLYHDPKPHLVSKLTKMVESDLKHSSDISFPEELIFEDNRFRGFVMKRVKGESFGSVYVASTRNKGIPQDVKFTIAKNLCIALHNVHEAGFVVGDFNPANIKVDTKRRTVVLMDTDSFIFDVYGGLMARPEVIPKEVRDAMRANESLPEGRKRDLPFSKESDTYSLAVHLFRLLMNGEHPFTYKPTRKLNHQPMFAYDMDPPTFPYLDNAMGIAPPPHGIPLESLPLELQTLFVRMFKDGYSDPSIRPSIMDFFTEIDNYEKESTQCRVDTSHRYHSSLSGCPFCEADRRYSQALKGIIPPTVPVSKIEYVFNLDYDFVVTHPEKVDLLERKASTGASDPNLVLGRLYSDGIVKEQNDRRAAEHFLKASTAKRPNPEAQYRLGLCFLDGIGVPQSRQDALKWLGLSSDMGYVPAQQLLEYIDRLAPVAPISEPEVVERIIDPIPEPVQVVEGPEPVQEVVKPKRPRRTPQQKCIDDVTEGQWGALTRLHSFVMDGKIDWDSIPDTHPVFKEAADIVPEYAFLYHEIMDKVHDFYESESYLLRSAEGGYVPAMLRLAQHHNLLLDKDLARQWYERAKAIDDTVVIPEELIVENRRSPGIRGGVSLFIDKIKGLWGRKKS